MRLLGWPGSPESLLFAHVITALFLQHGSHVSTGDVFSRDGFSHDMAKVFLNSILPSVLVFCLQVVWVSMQNEFIKQYKHYEELINKCYPDSNIMLEFTIDDVLQFFTNIAQTH